ACATASVRWSSAPRLPRATSSTSPRTISARACSPERGELPHFSFARAGDARGSSARASGLPPRRQDPTSDGRAAPRRARDERRETLSSFSCPHLVDAVESAGYTSSAGAPAAADGGPASPLSQAPH